MIVAKWIKKMVFLNCFEKKQFLFNFYNNNI